eukprot:scaffold22675_cov130-Amphora_coffeaeformis.AAC.1
MNIKKNTSKPIVNFGPPPISSAEKFGKRPQQLHPTSQPLMLTTVDSNIAKRRSAWPLSVRKSRVAGVSVSTTGSMYSCRHIINIQLEHLGMVKSWEKQNPGWRLRMTEGVFVVRQHHRKQETVAVNQRR